MKVLITGGSGFIGYHLSNYLLKKKHKILSILRTNKKKIVNKNIKYLFCDIESIDKHISKVEIFKPEAIIHLAWDKIPDFTEKNSKKNYLNSCKLIDSVNKISSVKKIIISGSCLEKKKTNKNNKYFVKYKTLLRKFAFRTIKEKRIYWLRIYYIFGKGQRSKSLIPYVIENFKKKQKFKIKNIDAYNNYIFISDFNHAIRNLLSTKYKSQIFDLKGNFNIPNYNICKFIEYQFNKKNIIYSKKFKKNIKDKNNYKIPNWKPKVSIFSGIKKVINN